MDFDQLLAAHSAELKSKADAARAALSHGGQKGSIGETTVISLLRDVLPTNFGFTEGVIISSDGYVSPQIDIIIYDRANSPIFFSAGSTKAIPIELVYAVIEVKLLLTPSHIQETSSKLCNLRKQKKYLKRNPNKAYRYHYAGHEFSAPPLSSFIFAFDTASLNGCWEQFQEIMNSQRGLIDWIDSIYVNNSNQASSSAFMRSSSQNGVGDLIGLPTNLCHIKDKALTAFLAQLWILTTQWKMLEPPELYRYFTNKRFDLEPARFHPVVDHPNLL